MLLNNTFNLKVRKMINRAIKYRLYPTEDQKVFFAKTFGCVRKVYNLMLSDKINSYHNTGELCKVTPAMYKEKYPFKTCKGTTQIIQDEGF